MKIISDCDISSNCSFAVALLPQTPFELLFYINCCF